MEINNPSIFHLQTPGEDLPPEPGEDLPPEPGEELPPEPYEETK